MSADRGYVPASSATSGRADGSDGAALEHAREAIAMLLGPVGSRICTVRYWDGSEEHPGSQGTLSSEHSRVAQPLFALVIRSPGGLRRMLSPPSELHFGEAYVCGDVDIEGDIEAAAGLAEQLRARFAAPREIARLLACASHLPRGRESRLGESRLGESPRRRERLRLTGRRHSRARDRKAVRSHYDVGNDFYSLWLDRSLVYSCAYFPIGSEDLDTAQRAKLDHLCRKLRLSPGERLLDIGCGWGGLIRHAAANYGVEALGVTLSERQAAFARERIRADGVERRCRVEVRDYRDFPPGTTFDKVVSVGMFEHVGRAELPNYFRQAARLTKPGGLFLNHGIVRARDHDDGLLYRIRRAIWREGKFIDRYVFPDGELVPLDEAVRDAECAGLETRDVETLRDHYAITLRQWVHRLEAARDAAEKLVGAQAYRVWRLYMAGSAYAFSSGKLSLAQVLLGRPDERGHVEIPRTRADLYAGGAGASAHHAAA